MSITSLAAVVAGLQPPVYAVKAAGSAAGSGIFASNWAVGNYPAAGSYNATLAGATLTAPQTGQFPFSDPPTGNAYLARFSGQSGQPIATFDGLLMLCDRLWHNGGIDITGPGSTPQTVNSPTWPARDVDGLTNGTGVLIGMEVSANTAGVAPTGSQLTIGYTNSAGASGRSAQYAGFRTIAAVENSTTFYPFGLQAGDVGVRSVQSVTLPASAWTSGTVNLVAYRVIATLDLSMVGFTNTIDAVTAGLPQIFNGSVLFSIKQVRQTNAATTNQITVQYAFG